MGYPHWLFARLSHPVVWVGALIGWLEQRLNRPDLPPRRRKLGGVLALLLVLGAVVLPAALLGFGLRRLPGGWVIEALLATPLLAQKHLGTAVAAVATGLDHSLADGRRAVREIVGRDPEALDEAGVARAAVESLAENASDGVVAPLFWLLVFGLPGIAAYKAVNTLDSMIGHKDARYLQFGWASARFDDLLNWISARLTGVLLVLAAFVVRGARPRGAWDAMLADAGKHDSPNAGWPEAAMAGALGLALGGPRAYDGEVHALPTMGDGRAALTATDIRDALRLYRAVLNLLLAVTIMLAAVLQR